MTDDLKSKLDELEKTIIKIKDEEGLEEDPDVRWLLTTCRKLMEQKESDEYKLKLALLALSAIRRATDDIPEEKIINRMAREALQKIRGEG